MSDTQKRPSAPADAMDSSSPQGAGQASELSTPAGRTLYERLLDRAREAIKEKPPSTRPSAAVVPWRRRDDGTLEVYWVRRNPRLRFMGGWHAFPGGRLEAKDAEISLSAQPQGLDLIPPGQTQPSSHLREQSPEPDALPGVAVGALRELFEEVGLLPLLPSAPALEAGRREEVRRQLLTDRLAFPEALRRLDLEPIHLDAGRLIFAGRWMTPPFMPVRFDNRFFLLEVEADAEPEVDGGELVEGEWIEPHQGLAAWEAGEVITSPPILHILRVLAETPPERSLERLRNPRETLLGPFRRFELRPGVVTLPLFCPTLPPATHINAFVLGLEEAVLVDPGSPFEREIDALIAAMEDLQEHHGITLRGIWITHHHPDHVGGVQALRTRFNLPVSAHPLTAQRLQRVGLEVDELLHEGDRVVLGGKRPFPVRVFHTPGHAPGHLCFYDETFGSLLAGDLIAGLGTIVIDPPDGDMGQYLASLQRMEDLAPRTLFPSHGPPTTDGSQRLRETRRHRQWREHLVLKAWNAGIRRLDELVPQVYEGLAPEVVPVATRQVEAHWIHLHQRGALEEDAELILDS